jgi:putative membrane protein
MKEGRIMDKPTEEQIRQRAHEIWERHHRPDGKDSEFWHQAEEELRETGNPATSAHGPGRPAPCRNNFCKPIPFRAKSAGTTLPHQFCLREEPKLAAEDGFLAWPIIVAWIHYVAIMLLIASLLGEHLLLKRELTAAQAQTIQRLDIVYGASAGIVLITGILRMFLEKGVAYYNQHIGFHILLGLFIFIGLLSIYPTVIFLRWRSDTGAGRGQQLASNQFKKIQIIHRFELTLLLLAPFFATWMAHGEF